MLDSPSLSSPYPPSLASAVFTTSNAVHLPALIDLFTTIEIMLLTELFNSMAMWPARPSV